MKYLKSRTPEIEIPETNPFENDRLERRQLCDILTDVVSLYGQSGCVMAICGEWGTGKTTFVKMWQQHLKNNLFKTLYFNAWSSDYTNDPLMAMISELGELSPDSPRINKLASAGARIGLSFASSFIKKLTGIDACAINDAIKEASDIGKEYLKKFADQKTTLEDFKNNIQEYIAENAEQHPVVFFIDELDRCNPHYAVAVLERIKHLFDIPNIIFVLAINKHELEHAIQGYYGSSKINACEYLRRFIDIEYALPQPEIEEYCRILYQEYDFDDFFSKRSSITDGISFEKFTQVIFETHQTNLRQMDRIYAHTRLALMQFNHSTTFYKDIFFLLCFWKVTDNEFYNSIRHKNYSCQELLDRLEEKLPRILLENDNKYKRHFNAEYIIALLLYSYDIMDEHLQNEPTIKLETNKSSGKIECNLKAKYLKNDTLYEAIRFYQTRSIDIVYRPESVFQRIELLSNFSHL